MSSLVLSSLKSFLQLDHQCSVSQKERENKRHDPPNFEPCILVGIKS